ncbi:MAG: AAA family ATPase [Bacteroidota bacterium]
MLKLPIGIQDFKKLREEGFLYVDKTHLIHQLLESGQYYFLSRPRRFGKSLLMSTLRELFLGNQSLFEGLWISEQYDWTQTHPVIHLSFNDLDYKTRGLAVVLEERIHSIGEDFGIEVGGQSVKERFRDLLHQLGEKKAVLLIDEYDKPIIDFIDQPDIAHQNKEVLRSFYSVIKDADPYLQFVFITGISKFSKVSIFSDLNNLLDITIDPNYGAIGGYTQEELETYFEDRIDKLATQLSISQADLLTQIRDWYNGYSWTGPDRMYNPFSILNFFSKGTFQNFWFSTGKPTFLIKVLQKGWYFQLDELDVGNTQLDFFDIENPDYRSLLFQTGYLTIKSQVAYNIYELGYPNKEVKDSLLQYLIGAYTHRGRGDAAPMVLKLTKAINKQDIPLFISILNSLYASIPEKIFRQKSEAAYHSVLYTSLSLMGFYIDSEVAVGEGYVDAVVKTETVIYVMEFKVGHPAEVAIEQIRAKAYAEPYRHDVRAIRLIGISFGKETKGVQEWKDKAL